MGKRKKSSRGPAKKVKQTLDTTFSCLFCNHERSVVCVMDKKAGVGNLSCKVCGQTFQAPINDVYSEWVDACEAVASAPAADKEGGVNETSEKDFVVDDQDGELSDLDESEFQ